MFSKTKDVCFYSGAFRFFFILYDKAFSRVYEEHVMSKVSFKSVVNRFVAANATGSIF